MKYYKKIRKCISMIRHKSKYVNHVSYYPDAVHKSKKQILKDQLYFFWKFGLTEKFYFLYGFDRVEMNRIRMINEYITPYGSFIKKVNHLNFFLPFETKDMCQYTGRAIVGDKFYFYLFLSRLGIPTPKVYCYIKNGNPLYFDDSLGIDRSLPMDKQLQLFMSKEMDAFAKPSDGECGHGVFFLKISDSKIRKNGKEISSDELEKILLSANYIIQERVEQHPEIGKLCPSTLNTIRIHTVRAENGEIIIFGPLLRIGRVANNVDNWAQGGVLVGIDPSGKLMKTGFFKPQYGSTVNQHPDTGVVFEGTVIPYFEDVKTMILKLHSILYRCHSIGWDVAITKDGPIIIEGNSLWEISMPQAAHGGLKYIESHFNY